LKELYGAEVTLVKSGGGVFEITSSDQLLFSKKSEGRFPDDNDLQRLVADLPD